MTTTTTPLLVPRFDGAVSVATRIAWWAEHRDALLARLAAPVGEHCVPVRIVEADEPTDGAA